ncbi:hypothetical protein SteCoe_29806 [Stentor coeruleus]|uniref:UBC core domain-containing protein n=1 Tax=Stentor coeruleus TaxID=5963 RepID=A0A1R2B517_9CILI|nr:hypothetical protein SteCoe_29806 [Stentor coeruleus]
MNNHIRRMMNEYNSYQKNRPDYIKVKPLNENLTEFYVILKVFAGTLFENGYFELKYDVGFDYPWRPPNVVFITPLYHPNISNDGIVHIDILKDQWSPALSLLPVLITLHSLLQYPYLSSPCNPEFQFHWQQNEDNCKRKAIEMCYLYAYSQPLEWDD